MKSLPHGVFTDVHGVSLARQNHLGLHSDTGGDIRGKIWGFDGVSEWWDEWFLAGDWIFMDFVGCFLIEPVSKCLNLSPRQMVQTSSTSLFAWKSTRWLGVMYCKRCLPCLKVTASFPLKITGLKMIFTDTGSPRWWRKFRGGLWGPLARDPGVSFVDCFDWLVQLIPLYFNCISTHSLKLLWLKWNRFVWFQIFRQSNWCAYSGNAQKSKKFMNFTALKRDIKRQLKCLVEWSSFLPVTLVGFLANLQKVTLFSFPFTYLTFVLRFRAKGLPRTCRSWKGWV